MSRVGKQARTRSKPVVIPAHPELTAHADAIRTLGRRAFDDVIEIGRRLVECRKLLKAQRVWLAWLKAEFSWSRAHADNLIAVYVHREKLQKFSTFCVSALYLLAKQSPESLQIIEHRAEAGERPSFRDIRQHLAGQRFLTRPQSGQQSKQLTDQERPQSEQRTLTTQDLREAAFRDAVLNLPRRLADFADFLADLPADDAAAALKPETRKGILDDIARIKCVGGIERGALGHGPAAGGQGRG